MKNIKLILFISLIIISTSSYSEIFTIEDKNLVDLEPEITAAIEASTGFEPYKILNCKVHGKFVPLSTKDNELVYFSTTKNACGWGSAVGPIWIIRVKKKTTEILLYSGGYSLQKEASTNFNLHDISVKSELSGGIIKREFSFDGNIYKIQ